MQPDESLDIAEGDLIEILRYSRDGESSMYRILSAVPSEDGLSVTIRTEPWPESLPGFYQSVVYEDTGNTGCCWPAEDTGGV